mgnify:CR=1 FL=1
MDFKILFILVLIVELIKSAFNTLLSNVKQVIREKKMNNKVDGFDFDEEEKETFEWPVRLTKPGSKKQHRVFMEFNLIDMDELEELQEQAEDDGEATVIVKALVSNWGKDGKAGFTKKGEMRPCDEENKEQVFNKLWITKQTLTQFFEAMGGKKAARKN